MAEAKPIIERDVIRLAMLGMVEGNGHPYSWSAMFNGYNTDEMAKCPYAGIPVYLGQQPKDTLQIEGARVTHIWTDYPSDARLVAKAALIPNVVERAEDVIGQVDAVVIATDIGSEHVARCRPFVEAGVPVFVDKPLVDNEPDLKTFYKWVASGAPIMSSSCMRYAKEYLPYRISTRDLGALRFVSTASHKDWERYGIHMAEGIYPIIGPGFLSARNIGGDGRSMVHLKHRDGVEVALANCYDMIGGWGMLTLAGTSGGAQVKFSDTFYAFKSQLQAFVDYLRTGVRPFPFEETVELMKIIIAGIRSKQEGGREVKLTEINELSGR